MVEKVSEFNKMQKTVQDLTKQVKEYEGLMDRLSKASLGRKSIASHQLYEALEKSFAGSDTSSGKTVDQVGEDLMSKNAGMSFTEAYTKAKQMVEGA